MYNSLIYNSTSKDSFILENLFWILMVYEEDYETSLAPFESKWMLMCHSILDES